MSARSTVPLWRRLLVGAAPVAGTVPLLIEDGDHFAAWLPAVFLALAAGAVHVGRLGLQLMARAAWWSALGLGTILCVLGSDREATTGAALSIGCAVALLAAGSGLAEATEREGFAPTTSRSGLLLLMVLALADAQTFGLMGAIQLTGRGGAAAVLLACAAAYVVAFVLMARLSLAGTWLAVGTSVVALALLVPRVVWMDGDFVPVVAVLGTLQILAAAPVLLAALRGRPLFGPWPARRRALAAATVVVGLVAVALLRVADVIERARF